MLRRAAPLCLLSLFFFLTPHGSQAQGKNDPLRLVPVQADIVVKLNNPSRLLQQYYDLPIVQSIFELSVVQEALKSTNLRQANQLLDFVEKKVGKNYQEIIEEVSGKGTVFALRVGPQPPPALLILQGTNAQTSKKLLETALTLIEDQSKRSENKTEILRKNYENTEVIQVGKDLYVAQLDKALVLAIRPEAMKAAISMHKGQGSECITANANFTDAQKNVPKNALAWAWVNLRTFQGIPQTEEFFQAPQKQPFLNLTLFGGMIDVARRAPFALAVASEKDNRYDIKVMMPRGLKGLPAKLASFYPSKKQTVTKPITTATTVFNMSYFLDMNKLWQEREKYLSEKELDDLDQFEKISGRFLGGTKISQLMEWSGNQEQIIVAQTKTATYKQRSPQVSVPSFAFLHEMSNPEKFSHAADRILRSVALLGTTQFRWKLVEEELDGIKLVSFQFPEDRDFPADNIDIRYAFSPTYFHHKNQFVVSSTVELAKDIAKKLLKGQSETTTAATEMTVYGAGLATVLRASEKELITNAVLTQAQTIDEAKADLQKLIIGLQSMRDIALQVHYHANRMELNLQLDFNSAEDNLRNSNAK